MHCSSSWKGHFHRCWHVEGASRKWQAILQPIMCCAWLILRVATTIILATFITIRVGCSGWLHSARCGLEAITGSTAKYRILCLSVLLVWFHCTSIRGGDGGGGLTVRGRWCHSCAESSSSLWRHWIESKIKAPNNPSRQSRASTKSLQPWHFRASCPLCWSYWRRVN